MIAFVESRGRYVTVARGVLVRRRWRGEFTGGSDFGVRVGDDWVSRVD